ncbi:MAG: methyltransferase domain-containing protein [Bacteroidales bacterium]|nr:methyltransferase domain-containing protein [Bacteroidales bacterium]
MDNKTILDIYLKRKAFQSFEIDDRDIVLQYMLKYIPREHDAPILDAGCGNGRYALKLCRLNYTGISAVDLFESIPVKDVQYFRAGIENLPFEDNSFRFIYAISVIYYPTDTEGAVKEFSRVLKPGGVVLITAHTKYSLFTLRRIMLRFLGNKKVKHLNGVRFKTASEYCSLLRNNGFNIRLVDGYNMSFILLPTYNYIRAVFSKYFHLHLPAIHGHITQNSFMARLKSIFAYHMIIVAEKTQ